MPRQRGMSLFPALMFLLVLSVIGVSAMNSTLMQEKMVSNTKDLNLAFQAAEAGLRDAEADVSKNIDTGTVFTSTCADGLCTPPSTWPTPQLAPTSPSLSTGATASKTRAYGAYTAAPALPTVASQPTYVIERLVLAAGVARQPGRQRRPRLRRWLRAFRRLRLSADRPRHRCTGRNARRPAINLHRDQSMNALKKRIVTCGRDAADGAPRVGALLSIAQYPLFLTHRTLPNVLVIYDNSESMDGTMAGKLIAGDDPTTRGNIARSVIRSTISSFSGQFQLGSRVVRHRRRRTLLDLSRTGWATTRRWCSPTTACLAAAMVCSASNRRAALHSTIRNGTAPVSAIAT